MYDIQILFMGFGHFILWVLGIFCPLQVMIEAIIVYYIILDLWSLCPMSTLVERLWNDFAKLCSWKIWNGLPSCWISLFFWRFLWRSRAKRNLHLIFLQTLHQILHESLLIFCFHLWPLWGTRKAVWRALFNADNLAAHDWTVRQPCFWEDVSTSVPFTLMKWVFRQNQEI